MDCLGFLDMRNIMVCGEFSGFPFCSHISCTWPAGASIQNCQQAPTTTTTKPPKAKKQTNKPTKCLWEKSVPPNQRTEKGWPINRKPFWQYSYFPIDTHSNTSGNYIVSLHPSTKRHWAPIPSSSSVGGATQEVDLSLPILWNQVCTDSSARIPKQDLASSWTSNST